MQTMLLGAILIGRRPDELDNERPQVYVIRDDATVFYVGKSTRDVCDRILEHCGLLRPSRSYPFSDRLGAFLLANAPNSHDWQVDLLTLTDCAPYVGQVFPAFKHYDTHYAETAAIMVLHPCLNCTHNDAGSSLPDKYRLLEAPATLL